MRLPPRYIPPLGPPKRSAREQVLADWRGTDLAPLEKAQKRSEKKLADVMPGVMQELRMNQRQTEAEIIRVWNHLVDPTVAAHAQPVGINRGTLFVNVDSSVWLDEIVRYRRREILERLQLSFGKNTIARISFRVG